MKPARFTAHLAPLGVPTSDGRVIDPAARIVRPHRPAFAYLAVRDPGGGGLLRLGIVDDLTVRDEWLVCAGEVFRPVNAQETRYVDEIRDGTLFPEMDLRFSDSDYDAAARGGFLRFTGGTLAAVLAGRDPAWPDVRFHLEES